MGTHVERHFRRAGLAVELISKLPNRRLREGVFFANVVGSGKDERFQIHVGKNKFQVLNVDKKKRHLLAHLQEEDGTKRKIVFGHDERHLFVAETGEQNISTVRQGLDSLAPEGAQQKGVVRQGEWFFLPMQHLEPPKDLILRNEKLPGAGIHTKPNSSSPRLSTTPNQHVARWPVGHLVGHPQLPSA